MGPYIKFHQNNCIYSSTCFAKYQCWPATLSQFEILAHYAFEFHTSGLQPAVSAGKRQKKIYILWMCFCLCHFFFSMFHFVSVISWMMAEAADGSHTGILRVGAVPQIAFQLQRCSRQMQMCSSPPTKLLFFFPFLMQSKCSAKVKLSIFAEDC